MIYGSVCSGIESASVAWEPLGMRPAWFSEIEPFPSAVLAHHWPHVENLGDMTKLAGMVRSGEIVAPDILVGGTPCQAFSVAGARKGLSDERGQLTISYGELLDAIDEQRDIPAIAVWENVPGVLTSRDNAFGAFLGLLAGEDCELQPPGKKWTNVGCVYGPKRTVAWRILDAQYFGVAQRRRRVFVVASARDDFDPTAVLFESEGVRRDSAPSRGQGAIASALTANGVGTCGADDNQAQAGHLVAAFGGGRRGGPVEVAACLVAAGQKLDFEVETFMVQSVHGTQDPDVSTERDHCLGRNNGGENAVLTNCHTYNLAVRRLTPVECELLQGFPPHFTLLPFGTRQKLDAEMKAYYERHLGRPLTDEEYRSFCGDGLRYRAIGNSKAVPVVNWLGRRILEEINA